MKKNPPYGCEPIAKRKCGVASPIYKKASLVGHLITLDAIILITKKYIYDTNLRSKNSPLYIFEALKFRFQQTYEDEQYFAILSNRQKKFNDVWNKWMSVFMGEDENVLTTNH